MSGIFSLLFAKRNDSKEENTRHMVSGKRIAVDSKRFEILAKRKRGKMETLLLEKIAASGRGT